MFPFLFASCSVGEFLTAYFNTYYNASRLFEEAEEEIASLKDSRKPDTTFLPSYNLQPATRTKLTSVVEKCSKILFDNSGSGLVDNSLMMIGKSYYYQNELQKAERKFGELISGYPESDFVPEAELLLAQTYYRMNEKSKAREAATVLADSTGGDDEGITGKAFLLLGQIQYENLDYPAARNSFTHAGSFGETAEERAGAYMRVAEMSLRLNDLEAALEAYEQAEDESSVYTSEYRAIMGQTSILLRLSEYDDALDLLDDLRSNANMKEFYAEIDLETANALKAKGEIEDAVAQYYYVDTSYARTESSARSHYELGYLYETVLENYDSALAIYARGRTQAPQSPVTQSMIRRADYLRKYKTYTSEIARLESLKTVILHPDIDTVQSSQREGVADSLALGDSTAAVAKAPLPSIDSVDAGLARNLAQLAGLFYSGLEVSDSAKFWYEKILDEHPSSPFAPKSLYTLAQISEEQQEPRERSDSLYEVLIRDFPKSPFAEEARRILNLPPTEEEPDPGLALYEEAQDLLRQDSTAAAISMFERIVREYPQSPLAAKAQYAIAWTYEEITGRPDSALVHFKKLVQDYPTSQYATVAFARLRDLPPEEVRRIQEGNRVEEPVGATTDSLGLETLEPDSTRQDSTGQGLNGEKEQ